MHTHACTCTCRRARERTVWRSTIRTRTPRSLPALPDIRHNPAQIIQLGCLYITRFYIIYIYPYRYVWYRIDSTLFSIPKIPDSRINFWVSLARVWRARLFLGVERCFGRERMRLRTCTCKIQGQNMGMKGRQDIWLVSYISNSTYNNVMSRQISMDHWLNLLSN